MKIRAHNSKGWGDFSELNTENSNVNPALIETVPSKMNTPTFDLSQSNNN